MPSDCLFCRIVAREVPTDKVTENVYAFAFRDISPVAPTHVLIVPKRHISNADEIVAHDAVDVAALFTTAQEVARIDGLEERGYRLVFNVGRDSGNTVDHLHLHVIGGHQMRWPPFPT